MLNNAALVAAILFGGAAQAQAPLSAIDWLATRAEEPTALTAAPRPLIEEPPVSLGALPPQVQVETLGAPSRDAVGLLPPKVTGLPADLWRNSAAAQLEARIEQLDVTHNPPLNSLLINLLLAEAEPPTASGGGDAFLLARVDKLMALGAVDPAAALLDQAGHATPARFAAWFETALLTDTVDPACAALGQAPHLTTDLGVRIYCLARNNDWSTALTLLQTGRALGAIDDRMDGLLVRFLDPEMAEDLPDLPPPAAPTALDFRLYEAVGERLATGTLPRRFAVTDLGGDSGWKAQLDAAERLALSGAVSANTLLGVYSARSPAASGGVWDRVDAVQRLDTALAAGDPPAIASALERAWPQMLERGLIAPLADLYGARLIGLPLTGASRNIAASLALLSEDYERAAAALPSDMPGRALLAAIATGSQPDRRPRNEMYLAVVDGFGPIALPERLRPLLEGGRLGETILRTMSLFETGAQGNPDDLTAALQGMRALGLEDTARRAALHLLLIELPA